MSEIKLRIIKIAIIPLAISAGCRIFILINIFSNRAKISAKIIMLKNIVRR